MRFAATGQTCMAGSGGIGRENGADAINEYTEVKTVWIDLGNEIKDPFNPRA